METFPNPALQLIKICVFVLNAISSGNDNGIKNVLDFETLYFKESTVEKEAHTNICFLRHCSQKSTESSNQST